MKSKRTASEVEDNIIDVLNAKIEPTIDFKKLGYEQIQTKGGIRWIKKKNEKKP